ncbi:hypothetical protein SDC9_101470 [bioreactor metagenome]|uniref:Uncharacterized protein n=1 Tax=bioreactor metagenome TaxID=1076179 RepID=A0A645AQU7_9ZZZZ
MADMTGQGGQDRVREAVCIETQKIYDSCRAKECLEDMRVYLTPSGQEAVNSATSVKPKKAEVLWAYIDVEPVPFNRGYYTVDIRYYFKISFYAYHAISKPCEVCGLSVYSKRVMLFGSEGSARTYTSLYRPSATDIQLGVTSNLPHASVEIIDPIMLSMRLSESRCCNSCSDFEATNIPDAISCYFDGTLIDNQDRRVYVTLGLFSIIRLSRNVQLSIPAYDFCMPDNDGECDSETPCDVFRKFNFPVDEFMPPSEQKRCD